MEKYISLGKFNKNYFFILGSISVNLLITFIIGFYPSLSPKNPIYLFGFTPIFLSHPIFKQIFKYFGIGLGGLILNSIFLKRNTINENKLEKKEKNTKKVKKITALENSTFYKEKRKSENKYNDIILNNKKSYKRRIIFVFFSYYFSKIIISSFDSLGFHQVKFWPLELLVLLYFAKKMLFKKIYQHQILSLSLTIIFPTLLFFINSFIPESNENCSLSKEDKDVCKLLTSNVYQEIIDKLSWFFIPIIILVYLLAMFFSAYSSVRYKWFIDFKYITIHQISIVIGVLGFIFSIILLIFISYIPCSYDKDSSKSICNYEYKEHFYYDTFKFLEGGLNFNFKLYFEIFFIIPLFLLLNLISFYFNLLIIERLDPFYLIPIETCYYTIYQLIDFFVTFYKTNKMSNIRCLIEISSDLICIFCCSIYLEIIELHFCDLDQNIRKNIILRGLEEDKLNELQIRESINKEDENLNINDENNLDNIDNNRKKSKGKNDENFTRYNSEVCFSINDGSYYIIVK